MKIDEILPLSYFIKNKNACLVDIEHKQKTLILTAGSRGTLVVQSLQSYKLLSELAESAIHRAALEEVVQELRSGALPPTP